MARTQLNARQLLNGTIQQEDIDTTTTGKAMITKVVPGVGITLSSTGVDPGTGIVTINAIGGSGSVVHHDRNVDGGCPSSVYLPNQVVNGGGP
jgi:hypothetical protein